MTTWLRALFSAIIPSPPIAIASSVCAGILCVVNYALIIFVAALFKRGPLEAVFSFAYSLVLVSAPAFYFTVKMSFIPNLVGIFFLFLSNSARNLWLVNLSRRTFYCYAACYGIIICMLSLFTLAPEPIQKMADVILLGLALSPAAAASGIITLKMVKKLLSYKYC